MGAADPRAVVRGHMEDCLANGDMDAIPDYFRGGEVLFNSGRVQPESVARIWRDPFPDVTVVIDDQIVEGDKVVTLVTFRGTHQGPYRGVAPTGKMLESTGVAVDRSEDGKVVEMWHWADELGLLLQLGAVVQSP